jgi:hypothetical protein
MTSVVPTTDLDLTAKEVTELASPDAITAFVAKLGYDTSKRTTLTPESIGLSGESAAAIKRIELLSEDHEQFLRVMFAQSRSLTAKVRNDLVRVLGKSNIDHMLILTADFDTLEFVLLDKRKRQQKGPVGGERIQVVSKSIPSVNRRNPSRLDLRTLRRFTWTCHDGLEQYDKLRSSRPQRTPANTFRTVACLRTITCGNGCVRIPPGGKIHRRCSPSSVNSCEMPRIGGLPRTRIRCERNFWSLFSSGSASSLL